MKHPGVRMAVRAGQFYEASPAALRSSALQYASGYARPAGLGRVIGGVVPHAGWMYSGPTAGKVFAALAAEAKPETYVLLGAVHQWYGTQGAVFPAGAWQTPLGDVPVDEELAREIVESGGGLLAASASAHDVEHSIEVQLPFIQVLSPRSRIVPIALPPVPEAVQMGEAIASVLARTARPVVVVASTDLTHYGMAYGTPDHGPLSKAMGWMRENDARIVRLAESLRAEEILSEAQANFNACGPGALAAAAAAVRALGASAGKVLEYTTSANVMGELNADRAVGYVGIVFEKRPS